MAERVQIGNAGCAKMGRSAAREAKKRPRQADLRIVRLTAQQGRPIKEKARQAAWRAIILS
jgi:hypothetical protein